MALSTTNLPATSDPFDLGIHTPANLNREARTALLKDSSAVVNGPVGVSPAPGRTLKCRPRPSTPSPPLLLRKGLGLPAPHHPPSPPGLPDSNRFLLLSQPIGSCTTAWRSSVPS
ncbi:hypothetical protein EDB80DRAFT_692216 [Ilyonectria destructans]|nr:hypothetical protein EDB80DRAFT_692216 [Ilyonectria destructans]